MPISQLTANSYGAGTVSGTALSPTAVRDGLGPGTVLQVVNTYLTAPTSQSIAGGYTTYTDLTGFSATITPASVNSKILVFVRWFGEMSPQTEIYNTMWNLKRNGTLIGQPAQPGSLTIGIHMAAISYYANDNDSTPETCFFNYYDSPNSTAAVTYQVSLSCPTGSTLYTNRCVNSATSGGYERGTSSIMLMEIAG